MKIALREVQGKVYSHFLGRDPHEASEQRSLEYLQKQLEMSVAQLQAVLKRVAQENRHMLRAWRYLVKKL